MQILKLTKKYEVYSEYKDSGVEWLGKIPKEWGVAKLKANFKVSDDRVSDYPKIQTLLSVSGYRGIETKNIDSLDGQMPSEDISDYRIVRPGQLVVNTMWLNYTGLGVSNYEGYVSPAYRAYTISDNLLPRFVNHLVRSNLYVQKYSSMLYGIRPNSLQVKTYDFEKIEILVPEKKQQEKIADYLDKKTSSIDQIIQKKQQQIELLKERRMVVINQAITKGLDSKASFVESGVDWIGKIPRNWKINRIKYIADILPSNIDKLSVEGETPVHLCNYTDVYKNELITRSMIDSLMPATATLNQMRKLSLEKDDVIITKDSETPDDIGIPAYVPEKLDGVVCGYHLAIIRPIKIYGGYLSRFFSTQAAKTQFFLAANGLTRYAIGIGDIGSTILPVPPKDEQKKIIEFLNEKITQHDKVIKYIERSIEKLQEFKSSLISNVVTGKVKI